ncbi:hypothetical protein DPMN_019404 [Dreissena polymorpha]|uniref:Uncharacterized protein n=1 Tax=Dreissena polymorpha TaxID=45954 RepID=A0A9D4S9A4_DREPO|nr:hypothetical protein DPMN_019404 [Dreissena polymorpha]
MESDSVHAAVENTKRRTSVFVPSKWDTIVRLARKKKTYTVVPMKHYDFHDLKCLAKSLFPQNIIDLEGRRIQWMKVKWLQFRKADISNFYVKHDFDKEFQCIKISHEKVFLSVQSYHDCILRNCQ